MAGTARTRAKVLVMEADRERAGELSQRLRFLNYEPVLADSPGVLESMAPGEGIAVLITDLPAATRRDDALRKFLDSRPELPVLLAGEKDGAEARLPSSRSWRIDLPLRRAQLERCLRRAERYRGREQRLTGTSRTIRHVRELIDRVAEFDTNVLVTGESGTGKELVARTIHDLSPRADAAFVPINCGAIPSDLLESELFGHEKGAFTGAVSTRVGRFELAEGGTLFLDEIGDMSLPMQVKLLRVLETRTFERVGSNATRRADVRIVAATHRDLPAMVAAGEFREDLYYRLNVFPIEMPPLCKRASDLPLLLDELLTSHRRGTDGELRLSPEALAALAAYPWPGNIRELSNLVERLAILCPEGEVGVDDLPAKYRECAVNPSTAQTPVLPASATLKDYLKGVECDLISQALARSGGVVAQAARALRMRRTTLLEKINKHGLAA